jgi:hypothetical protein
MILFGTPNLQMIDLINLTIDCLLILTTQVAFDHFVNLSMATYRYRYPLVALGNGPRMSSPHMANDHEGGHVLGALKGIKVDRCLHPLMVGGTLGVGVTAATARRRVLTTCQDVMSQDPPYMKWSTLRRSS